MTPWRDALPFFARYELACKGTNDLCLDPRFAAQLPALRSTWGEPLIPTSVCRTPQHNADSDGHPFSMHLTENPKWPTFGCMAADLRWGGWPAQKKLDFARLAWRLGWAVGLHDGFIHVDRRADLGLRELPKWIFLYGEWSAPFDKEDIL